MMEISMREALKELEQIVDGQLDCHTPEYRAINLLYRIVAALENETESSLLIDYEP